MHRSVNLMKGRFSQKGLVQKKGRLTHAQKAVTAPCRAEMAAPGAGEEALDFVNAVGPEVFCLTARASYP
jgi:hypothetical protein